MANISSDYARDNGVERDGRMFRSRKETIRALLDRSEPVALVFCDVAATYAAFYIAAWGRPNWTAATSAYGVTLTIGTAAAVNVVLFAVFHMYDSLWRYASISEMLRIVVASLLSIVCSWIVLTEFPGGGFSLREYGTAWAVTLILVAGVRLGIRAIIGSQGWNLPVQGSRGLPRSLIVGAGQTGSLTIKRMLAGDKDILGRPVGLVDDDPAKIGQRIHGVKVYGTCDDIVRLVDRYSAEQVVVAVPSATAAEKKRILGRCLEAEVKVLTLPNVRDIPLDRRGKVALQEVDVKDLLGREETLLDLNRMSYIRNKTVLVTGGGGSIGAELVRQLIPAKPRKIVVFDIYENTAYELLHEVRSSPNLDQVEVCVEIGSVTDETALNFCFAQHQPDVVFHAAAHKHVPLMEHSLREAVQNNVLGTINVAQLARDAGCSHFVLVSTDKAVNPTNVMGATKRLCELVVKSMARHSDTIFAAVRFGNVLGSHGSVVPLFQRQLRNGGPITLTHKDITRYFMTIPEAARLVITAGAQASGGEVYVLKMGDPVKIYDLAENLIKLSGLKVGRDVEIQITGLRPGEKLYEELAMETETVISTQDDKINVTVEEVHDLDAIDSKIDALKDLLDSDYSTLLSALMEAVPTFHPTPKKGMRS